MHGHLCHFRDICGHNLEKNTVQFVNKSININKKAIDT